jgi:hypothetical protein
MMMTAATLEPLKPSPMTRERMKRQLEKLKAQELEFEEQKAKLNAKLFDLHGDIQMLELALDSTE